MPSCIRCLPVIFFYLTGCENLRRGAIIHEKLGKGVIVKKHIVCLGDSNTHGYCADPRDCADGGARFNEEERWTCLLAKALGEEYLVLEEGLSGRTTAFADPLFEGMSAMDYLYPCLMGHEPVSLLAVMLGTNDTKERFSASAACIALGMEHLVQKAMHIGCWAEKPNILIIAPPVIGEEMEKSCVGGTMGRGCAAKSRGLAPLYADCARRLGCHFFDAAGMEFNRVDYMHLTRRGHGQMAAAMSELIPRIV